MLFSSWYLNCLSKCQDKNSYQLLIKKKKDKNCYQEKKNVKMKTNVKGHFYLKKMVKPDSSAAIVVQVQ